MISRSLTIFEKAERLIDKLPPESSAKVQDALTAYRASATADNYDRLYNLVYRM